MQAFGQQLIALEDRLKTLKQVIWLALTGCLFMLCSCFFLLVSSYNTKIYFLNITLTLISLIFIFGSVVFGFQEVGLSTNADQIMVQYLQRRENHNFTQDDYKSKLEFDNILNLKEDSGTEELKELTDVNNFMDQTITMAVSDLNLIPSEKSFGEDKEKAIENIKDKDPQKEGINKDKDTNDHKVKDNERANIKKKRVKNKEKRKIYLVVHPK